MLINIRGHSVVGPYSSTWKIKSVLLMASTTLKVAALEERWWKSWSTSHYILIANPFNEKNLFTNEGELGHMFDG